MDLNVALVPSVARSWGPTVCIVIDQLRASSTLVTLLDRGCPDVVLAGSLPEARRLGRALDRLIAGERHGLTPAGFHFNNSPSELLEADLDGRNMLLCTTNGTAVLGRLQGHPLVLVGCLMNARACSELAIATALRLGVGVGIVCAGERGQFALEDAYAAGVLVDDLVELAEAAGSPAQLTDGAMAARWLPEAHGDPIEAFADTTSGRLVTGIGFPRDIDITSRVDVSRTVPVLCPGHPLRVAPWTGEAPAGEPAARALSFAGRG